MRKTRILRLIRQICQIFNEEQFNKQLERKGKWSVRVVQAMRMTVLSLQSALHEASGIKVGAKYLLRPTS